MLFAGLGPPAAVKQQAKMDREQLQKIEDKLKAGMAGSVPWLPRQRFARAALTGLGRDCARPH